MNAGAREQGGADEAHRDEDDRQAGREVQPGDEPSMALVDPIRAETL